MPWPDTDRIATRLEQLWDIARGPGGGADRPAFSAAEAEAMLLVAGWAREAGLDPAIDRHGNLWAVPGGWDGPLVSSGSHVDTVPDGGRYDGALGTVLGLELALHPCEGQDVRPALLVCVAEEAPRFGAGTIGSRLAVGTLTEADLERFTDSAGFTAARAREHEYLPLLAARLPTIEAPVDRVQAHAEIHVAQRRALRELGIVTRVASPRRLRIELTGEAGHTGEVSMEDRRDALAAAAELTLAVEAAARSEPPATVATVGTLTIGPNSISVIPAHAELVVDMRAIDAESLDRLESAVRASAAETAARRGIAVAVELVRGGSPVALDPRLAAAALDAAKRLGIPATHTWSGAGHDAQHLGALFGTLLIFVPLHGGESHTPDEDADASEIGRAAVLASAVLGGGRLDSRSPL